MNRSQKDPGFGSRNKKPTPTKTPTYYSHPEVDRILVSLYPDENERQAIQVVLKSIVSKQHYKAARRDSDDYVDPESVMEHCWIPAENFAHLLTRTGYKITMDWLVEHQILDESSFTSALARHPTYRLRKREWLRGYRHIPVTSHKVLKRIETYGNYRLRHFPTIEQIVIPHIIENFHSIDLDHAGFMRLWQWRYRTKYEPKMRQQAAQNPRKRVLTWWEYMQRGEEIWLSIKAWNDASDTEKLQWFSTCSFGHRLHHPFTYWPSEIRAYILDRRGEPLSLIEMDLANSQPFIYANTILKSRPELSKAANRERYCRLKKSEFVKQVEAHTIYEDVARRLGITRDEAKVETLHWMYSMADSKAQALFEKHYGEVGVEARRIKSEVTDADGNLLRFLSRHKQLPKMMQRAESAMFKEIWVELIKQGHVVLPVHDAVYCANVKTKTKQQEIRTIFKKGVKKHMRLWHHIREEVMDRCVEIDMFPELYLSTVECITIHSY